MSTPEPTSGVPVWARKRRKPGNPLVGPVLVPLALFGALTIGLTVREKSFTAAGTQMDAWIALARDRVESVLHPSAVKAARTAAPKVEGTAAAVVPAPAPQPAPQPAVASGTGKPG